MNIYDFDKTIYAGDSSMHFFAFCLKKTPSPKTVAKVASALARYAIGGSGREAVKSAMFSVVASLPDTGKAVSAFWDQHEHLIYPWYTAQKRPDDLIISASPDFLLSEIARRQGFALIATKADPATGLILGANCRGEEKPRRLLEEKGVTRCENFYSDSWSDAPMARLANKAWLVKKGKLSAWDGL